MCACLRVCVCACVRVHVRVKIYQFVYALFVKTHVTIFNDASVFVLFAYMFGVMCNM